MPITDPLKKRIAWEALLNYKICRKCGSKNPINAVRCRRCKSKNLRKKHTKLVRR